MAGWAREEEGGGGAGREIAGGETVEDEVASACLLNSFSMAMRIEALCATRPLLLPPSSSWSEVEEGRRMEGEEVEDGSGASFRTVSPVAPSASSPPPRPWLASHWAARLVGERRREGTAKDVRGRSFVDVALMMVLA